MQTPYDCILDVVFQEPDGEREFVQALLAQVLDHYTIPKTEIHVRYLIELCQRLPNVNYPTQVLLLYIVAKEDTVQSIILEQLANAPAKNSFFCTHWLPYVRTKITAFEDRIDAQNAVQFFKLLAHNTREAWITQTISDLPQV